MSETDLTRRQESPKKAVGGTAKDVMSPRVMAVDANEAVNVDDELVTLIGTLERRSEVEIGFTWDDRRVPVRR